MTSRAKGMSVMAGLMATLMLETGTEASTAPRRVASLSRLKPRAPPPDMSAMTSQLHCRRRRTSSGAIWDPRTSSDSSSLACVHDGPLSPARTLRAQVDRTLPPARRRSRLQRPRHLLLVYVAARHCFSVFPAYPSPTRQVPTTPLNRASPSSSKT